MARLIKHLYAVILIFNFTATRAADLPEVLVYKSPTCTCCTKWADHMKDAGFSVTTRDETNMNKIKKELGVPLDKASCHTAVVGNYIIEGHVPPEDVIKLLDAEADVAGLTVPGMPLGSPGMEAPQAQRYVVYTFDAEGNTESFAEHGPGIDD